MSKKLPFFTAFLKTFFLYFFVFTAIPASAQMSRRNTKKSVAYKANYQRMSAGDEHALEIRDGSIWAWGRNQFGQLGDGTTVGQTSPIPIGAGSNWVAVEAGGDMSYGIKSDGTLWSWGGSSYGALGDGTVISHAAPAQIGTSNNWISVSAGDRNGFGIKSDGTLWGWGWNAYGQVGDGTTTQRNAPVQVGTGTSWVSVSAGYAHVLALRSDGTLWAWGYNATGQLGDATIINKTTPVQIGVGTSWTNIAAGYSYSAALRADGTLWAWGDNGAGTLGDGTTTQRNAPVQIGTASDWVSVSAASFTTLALKSNGTFWAWGENGFGTMGNGTATSSLVPLQMGTATNWVNIDGGYWFAVGLRADGTLRTWGRNNYGQIGNGTVTTQENTPIQIGVQLNNWLSISVGSQHTVAVKQNGTLWAWGENTFGQVGDGTNTQRNYPVQIGSAINWVSVTAGTTYSIGLKADGTLWGWGENAYGQLGNGTILPQNTPVQIGTASDWATIAAGAYHTVALKSNGTLWAWGRNNFGQLGDGTAVDKPNPVQIGVINTWTSIAVGNVHTLALRSNGTAWAWGYNFYGQLGDGSATNRSTPVQTGVAANWISLTGNGAGHSHGLRSDGTMYAWGYNFYGQLGDATTGNKSNPTLIGALNTWMTIAAGGDHTLGLKTDGTFWTWGRNNVGQQGDGTFTTHTSPVQLGASSDWVHVSGGNGNSHTIALSSWRHQYCYTGYNNTGQLGNCSTSNVSTLTCINPQPIVLSNPLNDTICPGGNATFTITADNAFQYQWQENGVNISGGSYSGYTTNSLTVLSAGAGLNGRTYRCIISSGGSCPPPDTSVAAVLTIRTPPAVSTTASPSNSICIGQSVTLTGGNAVSFSWTGGVTNGVIFTPGATATYTLTGTDVFGCQGTASITVTVNSLPTINSVVSPSSTVCSGASVSLSGLGGVSYTWTGGVIDGAAFFPTSTQTYTVTGTDGNGCVNTATKVVNVNPLPTITTNASPSNSICYGQIVTLTGGGANSYIWTGGSGGIFNGVGFQPLTTATYTVTGTDGNGCQNTNTIIVTVNPLPTVSSTASPSATLCAGQTVTLNGTGANTYTWSGGVFNGVSFTPGASATYTVTGTDVNGCQNTSTKTIVVNSLPIVTANVSPSAVICNGQNITLSGSGASSYAWTGGAINNVAFSPAASGTYTVTATDGNGCTNTATKTITVNPLPVVTSSVSSDTVCMGNSTTLTAAGANNYVWSTNAGSATSVSVSVNPSLTTTYTVTGTDLNSCSSTSSLLVYVLTPPTPAICLVTVDSALSNHNIIYWDKSGLPTGIDSFRIYREVTTSVYAYVASVHADSLSEYHDYAADPNVTSYKYKLSVIDSCGNESAMSDYHSTIHLQILGGGNLQWTLYDIEGAANPVVFYRVLRDDLGTHCCFLPISSTIPGGNSTYTDVDYALYPSADYRVDVTWGITCSPIRATVNTTRSNIKNNGLSSGINANILSGLISIYPNPAANNFTIELNKQISDATVKIMNPLGQVLEQSILTRSTGEKTLKEFDISSYSKGVYTILIESNGNKVYKKLVVN
jgi:alpha-tubulin suppressor-like RCC1 family protein